MKTIIVITSRLASSRLPAKALLPICGQSMILRIYERCKASGLPTVVATTDRPEDAEICAQVPQYFRGSAENVLDRVWRCADQAGADAVIRITGDCPFVDKGIILKMLDIFEHQKYDYLSNIDPATFPDGYDVEIVKTDVLKKSMGWAKEAELEHCTLAIRKNLSRIKYANFSIHDDPGLKMVPWVEKQLPPEFSKIHLSVDTLEDYLNALQIANRFAVPTYGDVANVLAYLAHNKYLLMNTIKPRSDEK